MVKHSPYHPKVTGLSPAAPAGTKREKKWKKKRKWKVLNGSSTVVEHLTHQPKVKGLSVAINTGKVRDKHGGEGLVAVAQW